MAALLFLMGAVESAAAATYYVDVDSRGGPASDTNPGTIDRPFKTIEKARDTIRALGTDGHTVYLRGGTYTLTAPLSFNYQDSGAAGLPNVYRNYPGETPVISGGQQITATWTVYSGNIWKCNVGSLRFNSLFVDDVRATRAREPDGTYFITQAPSGGYNWITFSGTDIKASWTHLTDVEIVSLDEYTAPRQRITSVSGQTCYLDGDAAYQIWASNRYWAENVFEGLDTPGEWYLDKTSGDLYYYPVGGKNPNTSVIVAGQRGGVAVWYTGSLLDVQGTSSNYAQYLEFRGLTFAHSDWYLPAGGIEGWSEFAESQNGTHATPNWYGQAPGIELRGVRYVTFADCTLKHVGGNGIRVYGDHVTVQNCSVSDVGATGIMLGAPSTSDSGGIVTSQYNIVQGNTVHDCGVVLPVGDGILAMIGGHNLISHNLVYNIPFMGINTGRAQGYGGDNTYNTVSYNEVYNAVWQVGDAAAIYFAGTQTGSIAHHNKVHDCPTTGSALYPYYDTGGYAFYIDEAASGITIRDNWIYRCNVGLRINSSNNDVFTNNVIATPGYSFFFCNGTPGTSITKNIYYNTTSRPVGIYNSVSAVGSGNANYNDFYNTLSTFQTTWNNWITQAHSYGLDLNSITSDPLFVGFSNDNLHLQTASRALLAQSSGGIGFQEIDMSTVGPQTSSYTITASAGTGGSITPSGAISVAQGGSQTFAIQANTGYSLSSVQVDGVAVGTVSSYTFTNVVANHTISAAFAAVPAASYTLNVSATNGSVTETPNQTSYTSGQSVSLQAAPNTGYNFTGWSGDLTGTANPATLVMNSNKSVTANFTANAYTLTISATNGSVTKTPNAASYSYGTVVTLQAVPNTGYTFSGWSGDASGTSSTTTVTMTANKTVTASFTAVPVTYALSVSATNGSVTKTPDQASYTSGQTVTLQAVPNTGYTFSGWSGDLTGTANPAILMMNANKTVAANFTSAGADQTPPVLGNCAPAPDSIQAPANTLVTLHLSDTGQGVDPTSVSITVDGTLVYSGDADLQRTTSGVCYRLGTKADYTYIYERHGPYGSGREVTVKVSARDLAGNLMPEQAYSFATEMYAFGRSRNASTDQTNLNQGRPATVSDGRGNLWFVWQAGNTGARHIYTARYVPDADTYNATMQLSRSTGDHCNPVVAIDSAGTLYVAWQENARGVWDVYLSTSADGTTWSTPKRIVDPGAPANPPFNQTNPALAAGRQASRLVTVAWQDDRAGNQEIYVARSTDAFTTLTASRVTSHAASQSDPAVAIDSQDTIFVLWTDARNGATDIYGAASNNGPWTNVPVVTAPGNQSQPAVAAATTGALLHIVWVDDSGGNLDVFYAAAQGLPASPVTGTNIMDDTSKADQQAPALAVAARADGTDGVFACWQDSRNTALSGDTDLYFADLSAGSVSANVLVDDKGTNSNQSEVALAVTDNGYPYLVWTDDAGKKLQVYYSGATYMDSVPLAEKEIVAAAGDTIGKPPQNIQTLDDVSVVIPAQACPFNATISIRRIRNPQGYATESLRIYDFGPSGLTFTQPVTITIPYPTRGSGKVRAYWFDSATSAFTDQGVTNVQDIAVASGLHALQFNTTHFTPYLVMEEATGTTGGNGGGCSLSVGDGNDVAGYFAPYLLLAAVVVVLRQRDGKRFSRPQ